MKKIVTLLLATTALSACNKDITSSNQVMTEEQVKLIIDNYIEENPEKIINEVNNYMAKMQAEQERQAFEDRFSNPVKIELDEQTPVKGDENSVITMVVFSDFECPFCQRVNPTLDSVLKKYQGKVKLAYLHLPLEFHNNAKPAALASIAANNQGKFWEFHDALFRNMQNLNEETYLKIANELNLDTERFKADMKAVESEAKLNADMQKAAKLGIGGTPHVLINGVPVSGAQPEEAFIEVIEKLLTNLDK